MFTNLFGSLTVDDLLHPELEFIDSRLVQLGNIKEGDIVNVSIRFKNIGDDTLILLNNFPTCNCTDVSYAKKVYNPGESGTINIKLDTTGKFGDQTIVVKLLTNSPQE